jgi:hypothetical protein
MRFFSMSKAAQGFSLRRTLMYTADGNPRRTPLIGKKTLSELEAYQQRQSPMDSAFVV